jgi:hypothetical protein
MRKFIVGLVGVAFTFTVYAGCTTTTLIMGDGMPKICTTCCDANNNCNVICV